MTQLGAAALAYAERGWRVFPLHGIVNGVCTCGRTNCGSAGKHPLVRRGLYEATMDTRVIKEWWRRWRSANIGLATGADSGIVVIDIDLPAALASLGKLIDLGVPRTLTGLTGGGGLHLVCLSEDAELGNSAGRLPGVDNDLPGIDLRANGGYIVAPPSVHASGQGYTWLDLGSPEEVQDPDHGRESDEDRDGPHKDLHPSRHAFTIPGTPIAPAPPWLKQPERTYVALDDVAGATFEGDGSPYGLAVLRDELDWLRAAQVGTRNHELNRAAFVLAQLVAGGELLESAARASLLSVALGIGLDEPESRQTIDSAFAAGLQKPRVAPHRMRRSS